VLQMLQVAIWRGGAAGVGCSAVQQLVKVLAGVECCLEELSGVEEGAAHAGRLGR
jgi:hypothetical protein